MSSPPASNRWSPTTFATPTALRAVRDAVLARAEAERTLRDTIVQARADGHSWAAIGAMVGTSGEAARQRYGHLIKPG